MFFTMKTRLWAQAHGLQPFTWWDRLPQIGTPALSNVQNGWSSPWTLLFLLLPPAAAWAWYPLFIDSACLLVTFWAGRRLGLGPWSAAWAAGIWLGCTDTLLVTQDPCYKEALFATVLLLAAQFAFWADGRRRWLALSAVAAALHNGAGSPTAMFYDVLTFGLLLPGLACWQGAPRRRLAAGLLAAAAGLLLWMVPWLALRDMSAHSHRLLPGVHSAELADAFHRSPLQTAMCLAAEGLAVTGPLVRDGYPVGVQLSLAVTGLALLSLRRPRLRPLFALALLCTIQSVGERGGFLWLLHRLVPATLDVRAPARFFHIASLGWCWLAAAELARPARTRLVRGLALWAAVFTVWSQTRLIHDLYVSSEIFTPPPFPPVTAGRVASDPDSQPRPPLLWEGISLTAGLPTLIYPETLLDGRYALGMACSQWGSEGLAKLARATRSSTRIPLLHPDAPLLRCWGLTWLLAGSGDAIGWKRLQPDPPRHWVAEPVQADAEAWAAARDWQPFDQAQVEAALPTVPRGHLTVEIDEPDRQRLVLEGSGLVVSADTFDPGWSLRVDGQPAEPLRADVALKACWVPEPGRHTIEWSYAPPWLGRALLLHALGWVALGAAIGLSSRRPPATQPR